MWEWNMFLIFGEYFACIFYNKKGNTFKLFLEMKKYLENIVTDSFEEWKIS